MNQPVSINYSFDATKYDPSQTMVKHPTGKYLARITGTDLTPVRDKPEHGRFVVEFTTPAGTIQKGYNLWFPSSPQTADIAHRELSALCHCVGVFRVEMANRGRELIGAECGIEVAVQEKNPEYNQVAKVFDRNGNEPGKGAAPQQQQPQAQPQAQAQAQPQGGGFGQQPQAQPTASASPFATPAPQARPAGNAFGGSPQAQPQQQQPQQTGWTQQAPAGQQAPWAT